MKMQQTLPVSLSEWADIATCLLFSKKLEACRLKHFVEDHLGDHGNMLAGFHGRIYTELLPFFEKYLK